MNKVIGNKKYNILKNFFYNQKIFIKFLIKLKFPWILFAIQSVIGIATAYVFSFTQITSSKIMSGQIYDTSLIKDFITISIVVLIISTLLHFINMYAKAYITKSVRTSTWRTFVKMSMKSFEEIGPSTLISRLMNDASFAAEFMVQLIDTISTFSKFGFLFLQLFMVSGPMIKLVIPSLLAAIAFIVFMGWYHTKYQMKSLNANSIFTAKLAEKFADMKYIKSRNTEEREKKYCCDALQEEYKVTCSYATIGTLLHSIMSGLPGFMYKMGLFIGGGILINKHIVKLEEFNVFYISGIMIPMYAVILSVGLTNLIQRKAGVSVISRIFDCESDNFDKKIAFTKPNSNLSLENVSFGYNSDNLVLRDVSFNIEKGKTTAIVGPSGSGKTTILKLLDRFYNTTSGLIKFGEDNISKFNIGEYRKTFGYVVQNSPLLVGTIRDNIVYGLDKEPTEEEIKRACSLAKIDFLEDLTNGINTDIGEAGGKLSGGQKQRIAIARALIKDPEYLLLDEATANLDINNEVSVTEAINNLMKDRTVVVVTHNLSTVKNADKIIVLKDGMVEGEGTHSELYNNNMIYKSFIDVQAKYK